MVMRIGELAQKTGVSPDTIRFYEKQGLLDASLHDRHANNYRMYRDEAVERLLLIKQAKRFGFTLSELKQLGQQWDADSLSHDDKILVLQEKFSRSSSRYESLRISRAMWRKNC
ncbi:MerR family transcriptional regulator [Candidatus Gracilibacteria bacterium]|nr:MerR family transcriptional regulator [Candidatus Gracilibacteria bacterium]